MWQTVLCGQNAFYHGMAEKRGEGDAHHQAAVVRSMVGHLILTQKMMVRSLPGVLNDFPCFTRRTNGTLNFVFAIECVYKICYNIHMMKEYKLTKTTVSLIKYHIVFCPRYRRKIFDVDGLEKRFKELTMQECKSNGIDIYKIECCTDYVYMYISVYPQQSIPEVVKLIKGATSHKLREEFPELSAMPSLWTRNYFVSTDDELRLNTIEWYVNMQKKRD